MTTFIVFLLLAASIFAGISLWRYLRKKPTPKPQFLGNPEKRISSYVYDPRRHRALTVSSKPSLNYAQKTSPLPPASPHPSSMSSGDFTSGLVTGMIVEDLLKSDYSSTVDTSSSSSSGFGGFGGGSFGGAGASGDWGSTSSGPSSDTSSFTDNSSSYDSSSSCSYDSSSSSFDSSSSSYDSGSSW